MDIYAGEFFNENIINNSQFNFHPDDENSVYKIISEGEENNFFNFKNNNF